jgi:hypothetical protein
VSVLALLASFPALVAAQTVNSQDSPTFPLVQASSATEKRSDAIASRGDEQPNREQSNDESHEKRNTETQGRQAIEIKPEVQYLRDRNGQLVPVPGISYEEFTELFRLR